MEKWSSIIGVSGYEVSNQGSIRNYVKGNLISPSRNTRGYLQVDLRGKTFRVHRLVAIYFVKNPNSYPEVNHKDGNKLNNTYTNLEWCTRSYNLAHGYRTGLRVPSHQRAVAKCDSEWNIIETYCSISEAARKNNIHVSNIQVVASQRLERGKYIRKTAGGHQWKFL